MGSWQHFHHQADIGIRGIGTTLDEVFVEAALALTAVLTDPAHVREQPVAIRCASLIFEVVDV